MGLWPDRKEILQWQKKGHNVYRNVNASAAAFQNRRRGFNGVGVNRASDVVAPIWLIVETKRKSLGGALFTAIAALLNQCHTKRNNKTCGRSQRCQTAPSSIRNLRE